MINDNNERSPWPLNAHYTNANFGLYRMSNDIEKRLEEILRYIDSPLLKGYQYALISAITTNKLLNDIEGSPGHIETLAIRVIRGESWRYYCRSYRAHQNALLVFPNLEAPPFMADICDGIDVSEEIKAYLAAKAANPVNPK